MKSKFYFKFEDLLIYKKAIDFGELVNDQIKSFPKEETYRLSSQFIRVADSIAHECVVCSTKAKLRNFITEEIDESNREAITELSKMISSYKNYLKKKLNTK